MDPKTVREGLTPQRAKTEAKVASRKPQPEILIGNMSKRLKAGKPIIRASVGTSAP